MTSMVLVEIGFRYVLSGGAQQNSAIQKDSTRNTSSLLTIFMSTLVVERFVTQEPIGVLYSWAGPVEDDFLSQAELGQFGFRCGFWVELFLPLGHEAYAENETGDVEAAIEDTVGDNVIAFFQDAAQGGEVWNGSDQVQVFVAGADTDRI